MAGLTSEEFKGYAALFWKCELITEEQYDKLVTQHNSYTGWSFPEVASAIEKELRK